MEHSKICEHAVKQRIEGKYIAKRVLLIALYTAIPLVSAFLGLIFKNVLPFLVVAALLDVGLIPLTWRRTCLEYEYTMTGGTLVFSHIYGGSARKVIFETELSEIEAAFPNGSEKGMKLLADYAPEKQYYALSTLDAAANADREVWCCLFENEDGDRAAFWFELTDSAYRILRTSAGSAVAPRRERAQNG